MNISSGLVDVAIFSENDIIEFSINNQSLFEINNGEDIMNEKDIKDIGTNALLESIEECFIDENEYTYGEGDKVDIPYWMSVLNQHLHKYPCLIDYIGDDDFHVTFIEADDPCIFGTINVYNTYYINKDDYHTIFKIKLMYEPRYWGYCECDEEDEGYDARHKCCGYGCDWNAPSFEVYKEEYVGRSSFSGIQHDIWDLEDEYYNITLEKKKELEIKLELESLKRDREILDKRLAELELELTE